jgi:hypothetical protein
MENTLIQENNICVSKCYIGCGWLVGYYITVNGKTASAVKPTPQQAFKDYKHIRRVGKFLSKQYIKP